jgi:hypothetical protein
MEIKINKPLKANIWIKSCKEKLILYLSWNRNITLHLKRSNKSTQLLSKLKEKKVVSRGKKVIFIEYSINFYLKEMNYYQNKRIWLWNMKILSEKLVRIESKWRDIISSTINFYPLKFCSKNFKTHKEIDSEKASKSSKFIALLI